MEKIKKISCVTIAVVVLVSIVCIPALAYTDTSLNGIDFEDQPIPTADPTNLSNEEKYDAGFDVVSYTSSSRLNELSYFSTSNENVYAFGWKQSDSEYRFILASTTAFDFVKAEKRTSSSGTVSFLSGNASTASYNEYENLYVISTSMIVSASYNPTFNIPIFATRNDGVAALKDWIENPSTPLPSPGYFSLNLNPGYVAFIDITDLTGVSVSLDTTLFGGADWNNHQTDQNIGLLNSMPSSFSLPIAGTNHINWSGTGSKNILGQYKSFKANYTYSTVGNTTYLVIVNPLQARMDAQLTAMASMPSQRNNPIFITVSQARTCKIYSLTSSLDVGSGNLDIETNGETYSGSNDGEGNWTYTNDETGTTVDPDTLPIGGGNDPIIGQETSINDWLQNIANQIKGFFSGAIGAVTTLVSAGSAFINSLVGLYSWLPAPVYSVLSAALIIVITVGVIKVFI